MAELDELNVCCRRYFARAFTPRRRSGLHKDIGDIQFLMFTPHPTSMQLIGKLRGKFGDEWRSVNIILSYGDMKHAMKADVLVFQLVQDLFDKAVRDLNQLADDDFQKWIKDVKNGKVTATD